VLYVIDSVVPGGAERSLAAIAPHLISRGVALDVAYLKDRAGLQPELAAAGARLHCLDGPGGRVGWAWRASICVGAVRPDLVHTTLFEADIAGRVAAAARRTPVVSSLVNVNYGPDHYGDPSLRRWRLAADQLADAATARVVRRFHAVSGTVASLLGHRLRLDPTRIDVIPRGRDPATLGVRTLARRAHARAALGVTPRAPVVLAVARQEHPKGLDVLLRALPSVAAAWPEVVLLVAGREGNQTSDLRRLIGELGVNDRTRLLGERSDVADLLCAADVFVLPSRREGLPGALLEAMALEAPAVASDIPQVREVVSEDTAWLVRADDPQSLSLAMQSALADDEGRARRAAAARRTFEERFTIDVCADRMIGFYRRSLGDFAA
jgi:glycosyltransferase involved in cell wall biosynthesis